ncbi:MAG: hypothetical protein LWW75_09725, partial [Chlorobiales bacterium]|nr:hypothetical protein [Chlorobiales bacterium]
DIPRLDCCVGWCSKSSRTTSPLRFLRSIRLALKPLMTLFSATHGEADTHSSKSILILGLMN